MTMGALLTAIAILLSARRRRARAAGAERATVSGALAVKVRALVPSIGVAAAALLFGGRTNAAQEPDICNLLGPGRGVEVKSDGDSCTWSTNFSSEVRQQGYLSVTLTRYDTPGEACAVLTRLQNSLARESRATMGPFEAPGWERAFTMSAPQHDLNQAKYAVGACYESYLLFGAALSPSPGRTVPIDIQNNVRAPFSGIRERLSLSGAVARTPDEAEKDLVSALGPDTSMLNAIIDRLKDGLSQIGPSQNHPASDAAERELRDRVRASGGDASGVNRQLIESLRRFTNLAQLQDKNDRAALPSLRQSLPVLMHLATTAATHPDPVTANQAQTALGRYAAMVFRIDAQALIDRVPNP
jgi:hypothetical protein